MLALRFCYTTVIRHGGRNLKPDVDFSTIACYKSRHIILEFLPGNQLGSLANLGQQTILKASDLHLLSPWILLQASRYKLF